ncbi:hypothetical protein GCM10025331_32780 [Actinoplanes utahensis]
MPGSTGARHGRSPRFRRGVPGWTRVRSMTARLGPPAGSARLDSGAHHGRLGSGRGVGRPGDIRHLRDVSGWPIDVVGLPAAGTVPLPGFLPTPLRRTRPA